MNNDYYTYILNIQLVREDPLKSVISMDNDHVYLVVGRHLVTVLTLQNFCNVQFKVSELNVMTKKS